MKFLSSIVQHSLQPARTTTNPKGLNAESAVREYIAPNSDSSRLDAQTLSQNSGFNDAQRKPRVSPKEPTDHDTQPSPLAHDLAAKTVTPVEQELTTDTQPVMSDHRSNDVVESAVVDRPQMPAPNETIGPITTTEQFNIPDPMMDNTMINQSKPEVITQKTSTVLNVDHNKTQHIDHQPVKGNDAMHSNKQSSSSTTKISPSNKSDSDQTMNKDLKHAIDPNIGIEPKQPLDSSTVEQPFQDKSVARPYPVVEPAIKTKQDKAQPSPVKPHKQTTPQVRIGHISVLVEDRSVAQPKQGQKAPNTHRNPFGLRGL